MRIAIIGSGNVGTAIAKAVTGAGHDAVVAGPSEDSLEGITEQVSGVATTTSNREAVTDADVVVLAVPFHAVQGIAADVRDELAGKVVVDVTNPMLPDLSGLATEGVSAAELVQQAAPEARVVKAFNTVFAGNQAAAAVEGTQLDGSVAADDGDAKQTVIELPTAIGYRPVFSGEVAELDPTDLIGGKGMVGSLAYLHEDFDEVISAMAAGRYDLFGLGRGDRPWTTSRRPSTTCVPASA